MEVRRYAKLALVMLRRAVAALWFALLLVGQQGAAWHALSHATERLERRDDSAPVQSACDQCFLGAQLSSALGTAVPELPALPARWAPEAFALHSPAPADAPVYFRSRAPPPLLS